MVEIILVNNTLKISILGIHKLLSLKSHISILIKDITSARLNIGSESIVYPKGIRMLGTNIFPFLVAGTYKHSGNEFWDVRDWRKSIIIETQSKYKRIIVEVKNPLETISFINKAIKKN